MLYHPLLGYTESEPEPEPFYTMPLPLRDKSEINADMTNKEIAEIFSARLMAYLKEHFDNFNKMSKIINI